MSAGAATTRPCPDLLPMLAKGSHHDPRAGACVMEYASVLAGEKFSDHPQCVHPAVAGLARAANDRIRDDRLRSRLALLVPDMIAIDERDPRVGPQVVVTCLMAVAEVRPLPRWAGRRLMRAERRARLAEPPGGRWDLFWQHCRWAFAPPAQTARRALLMFEDYALDQADEGRDRRLYELVEAAVEDCRGLEGAHSRARAGKPAVR